MVIPRWVENAAECEVTGPEVVIRAVTALPMDDTISQSGAIA